MAQLLSMTAGAKMKPTDFIMTGQSSKKKNRPKMPKSGFVKSTF